MRNFAHPLTAEERWRKIDLSVLEAIDAPNPDLFDEYNEKEAADPVHIDAQMGGPLSLKRESSEGGIFCPRLTGTVSDLKLIEENTRRNGIIAAVTHIEVEEGGSLDYLGVMRYHNSPTFSVRRFVLNRNARADINFFFEGGGGGKERIELWLEENAEARIGGIASLKEAEFINIDTLQLHQGRNGVSDLLFLGINRGSGKGVFEGMIRIEKGADESSAVLANENLLTGPFSKAESIPRLEILADDVTCSHKATVGRPNEDEIFYMNSRGISRERAVLLIEEGFKRKVLARLGKEHVGFKETIPNI